MFNLFSPATNGKIFAQLTSLVASVCLKLATLVSPGKFHGTKTWLVRYFSWRGPRTPETCHVFQVQRWNWSFQAVPRRRPTAAASCCSVLRSSGPCASYWHRWCCLGRPMPIKPWCCSSEKWGTDMEKSWEKSGEKLGKHGKTHGSWEASFIHHHHFLV